MTNVLQRMRRKVRERMDWLYLRLSDCDGMCDHCEPQLKELCLRRKGKTEKDLQLIKKVHSYREKLNDIEDPEEGEGQMSDVGCRMSEGKDRCRRSDV
jgi:hypothetical protein